MATVASLEKSVLSNVTGDIAWSLVQRFSSLARVSGSTDEREAAAYICQALDAMGIAYEAHEPELYLSVPLNAAVIVGGQRYRAKCPSFSSSTPAGGVTGQLHYLKSGSATGTTDLFDSDLRALPDLRGRIALVDGMAMPLKVSQIEAAGAAAAIFINPGNYIHEGICTTVWGTPGVRELDRMPRIPVVSVSRPDGEALLLLAGTGTPVTVETRLEEGWRRCPLIVAEIRGEILPEQFVLLHGHLDSWHYGIGDNATGNGALLELSSLFSKNKRLMARSLRVAWWPGHSTGRYAGSTWYADHFALDLLYNCIAQVNCDSPGCRWATEYTQLSAMTEAAAFVKQVIKDVTGLDGEKVETERPPRAGDYSFNNLGITGFFMLSSTMPENLRAQKGYYAVGGCGGNIEWHTEDDTLTIADRLNLVRDMKVYAAALSRVINASVLPFDFRHVAAEFKSTLTAYQKRAGKLFDFSAALHETDLLCAALDHFHRRCEQARNLPHKDPEVMALNRTILSLARVLIPVNYATRGRFYHDPALNVPPLPALEPVEPPPGMEGSLKAELTRGSNQYIYALRKARQCCEAIS